MIKAKLLRLEIHLIAVHLYFNGYSVDRHGNIRIPYIGEVNVLGVY